MLGLVIGFAGTVDTVQPISMITYLGLSILGGLWFPVEQFPPFLQDVAKVTPSYWLADLGRSVVAGDGVPLTAVLVLADLDHRARRARRCARTAAAGGRSEQ